MNFQVRNDDLQLNFMHLYGNFLIIRFGRDQCYISTVLAGFNQEITYRILTINFKV